MLSEELLLQLLRQRKCVKSRRDLQLGESFLSRQSFPKLFAGEFCSDESGFVSLVFKAILRTLPIVRREYREDLRVFMEVVLRNGQYHREDFLHRYLYEFWSDVCCLGEWGQFDERFFECSDDGSSSEFSRRLLPLIRGHSENYPDILAISSGVSPRVAIIEVKNDPLDDRALGQILRYYQVVRTACDRLMLLRQTSKVCPILVVPEGSLRFWDAIPFHFREVLEIFYWRIDHTGAVTLMDGKSVLRRLASERLRPYW